MEVSNKRELPQIVYSSSLDIDFEEFMNLYKKCTKKPHPFLDIDTIHSLDDSLSFRNNLSERI